MVLGYAAPSLPLAQVSIGQSLQACLVTWFSNVIFELSYFVKASQGPLLTNEGSL